MPNAAAILLVPNAEVKFKFCLGPAPPPPWATPPKPPPGGLEAGGRRKAENPVGILAKNDKILVKIVPNSVNSRKFKDSQ